MDFLGKLTCNHVLDRVYSISTCPRCLSKGWYGDIQLDGTGDISLVSNEDYTVQAISKIIMERLRKSGYGFNFDMYKPSLIMENTLQSIKFEVKRTLAYLIETQRKEKALGVVYSTTEEIVRINYVDIETMPGDPRYVYVIASVNTRSGEKGVKVPLFR